MDNAKTVTDVLHNSTTARQVGELLASMLQFALNHPFWFVLRAMLCLAFCWGGIVLVGWIVDRLTPPAKPSPPPEPTDWVIDIRDSAGNVVRTLTIPAEQVGRMTRAWDEKRKRR